MRIRLALLFSAVTGIVVIALDLYTYMTMARVTENNLKRRIAGTAQLLTAVMTQVNPTSTQSLIWMPPLESFEGDDTVVQVLGQYGNVLVPSPRLGPNEIVVPAWALRAAVPAPRSSTGLCCREQATWWEYLKSTLGRTSRPSRSCQRAFRQAGRCTDT